MTKSERRGLVALVLMVLLIVLPVLVALCAPPTPQQASAPVVGATTEVTETPAPTTTVSLMGPASPHASSTLRPIATADPTVTSVVIVPTAIPTLTPLPPMMTATPEPTVTPMFLPQPRAPAQIPGERSDRSP